MVKLPRTLVEELKHYCGTDKQMRVKEVENHFINAGYGPKKAHGWILTLIEAGLLELTGRDDKNNTLITSILW